jgi:hypothetical protein
MAILFIGAIGFLIVLFCIVVPFFNDRGPRFRGGVVFPTQPGFPPPPVGQPLRRGCQPVVLLVLFAIFCFVAAVFLMSL